MTEECIKCYVVFKTEWSWHDVLSMLEHMGKGNLVKAFEETLPSEQERIVKEFSHMIGKGMEAGIMSDWNIIMQSSWYILSSIEESGVIAELEDLELNLEDYNYRMKMKECK